MAFQKKVLRKQGDKFQLVDKDQEEEAVSPTQGDLTQPVPEVQPERSEIDHWEELRISIRKKYEAQKQKTQSGLLDEPRSERFVHESSPPQAVQVERASSKQVVLADRRARSACLDDIALERLSRASHGSSRLRKVRSTGSIDTQYSRGAGGNGLLTVTPLDHRTFYRYPLPGSGTRDQSSGRWKVREVGSPHVGPRYQRRTSFDRPKRYKGFDLPDVPEVPEIPPVFQKRGRASSAVFQRSSGHSDMVIDTSKHSWPQRAIRSGFVRQEIPRAMALKEVEHEEDLSHARRTRNSFAYDLEKKKTGRQEALAGVRSPLCTEPHPRESIERAAKTQYTHESENDAGYAYRTLGREGTALDSPAVYEERRVRSLPLPAPSFGSRRATGRWSGDEPRVLLNSGNIPFTPRPVENKSSSHSHSSTHRPFSSEPPLKSILKRPGSSGSSSSNPFFEQIETSAHPVFPASASASHSLPSPTDSKEDHGYPSRGSSSIHRSSSSTKSQQSLRDTEPELPLRVSFSSVSRDSPSTPQSELGRSENTVTTFKHRLEARSPYANRPSPRGDFTFEEVDDEHSVNTSAALINVIRAGPPPRFEASETLPPEDRRRGRRPELNKKRSFKELCKDIAHIAQPVPSEQPGLPLSKSIAIPTQRPSKPSQRSKSLPRKVEGVLGSIGRNIKQSAGMEDKLAKLSLSSDDKSQFVAVEAETDIPIELRTPGLPQSSLPDLAGKEESTKATCDSCNGHNAQTRCRECGAASYCTGTRTCYLVHLRVCQVVQRPHTSYRMHSSFAPESLRKKEDYMLWQRGSYVEMRKHLEDAEAVFRPQLKSGQGALIKEFRKELGWSKSMQNRVASLPNDLLEDMYERFLRRVFMMPLLEADPADPSTKHPGHKYHRRTAMLRCVECKGHCANCGVDCCVHRAIEMDVQKKVIDHKELHAMQMIKAEIDLWVRRGNPSIFAQCTDCVAEGNDKALYCPNCFGVCPLGQGKKDAGPACGDVLCAKHQSVLDAPCDWHGLDTQPATGA